MAAKTRKVNKMDDIDALLRTAGMFTAYGTPLTIVHDGQSYYHSDRVKELLKYNNEQVELRRELDRWFTRAKMDLDQQKEKTRDMKLRMKKRIDVSDRRLHEKDDLIDQLKRQCNGLRVKADRCDKLSNEVRILNDKLKETSNAHKQIINNYKIAAERSGNPAAHPDYQENLKVKLKGMIDEIL